MKIMKILRKTLKNYIRSKNRHFKVIFFKIIYIIFHIDNNIIYVDKKI